jgi:hypothetical protein
MRRVLLTILCLGLLPLSSLADDDAQTRGESLLQHARTLSDIRSEGSPAFRLKATFSFTGERLDTVEGTYTETWISDSQSRREIEIGNTRYVEVSGPGKYWLVRPDGFPAKATKILSLMTVFPPFSSHLDFASISDHVSNDIAAACAFGKPNTDKLQFVFCFDKKTGLLLETIIPERRPRNVVNLACSFGTFRKFGNYWFPHGAVCSEERHKAMSADIVELTIEPPIDPALFDRPQDSIELDKCSGKLVSPTLYAHEMASPGLDPDRMAWIQVWFVVDLKGRPQHVQILHSVVKGAHENALRAVRNWRLEPATCDGKRIQMPMMLEIPSTPK